MAKSLYSALFDWIVLRINHALLNKKDMEESVSVSASYPPHLPRWARRDGALGATQVDAWPVPSGAQADAASARQEATASQPREQDRTGYNSQDPAQNENTGLLFKYYRFQCGDSRAFSQVQGPHDQRSVPTGGPTITPVFSISPVLVHWGP